MNVLILGANGFIGSHLCEAILNATDWRIAAIDLAQDNLANCLSHPRFNFLLGDITQEKRWITTQIQQADVVLPLVAIATPALYIQNPLRIFELDFEANLEIIRLCVEHRKRIIFPSTSEVYGMCEDQEFDEEKSHLVTGPIHKERWIYSSSKQLLDRLIYAYGKHKGLTYTLFRPFNWYGPRLDRLSNPKPRVTTQFIANILQGEAIQLVNGGLQQRCFIYVSDGIDALLKIIENKNQVANHKIFNIGNPNENLSILDLAKKLLTCVINHFPDHAERAKAIQIVATDAALHYGEGYQDVTLRVPSIRHARQYLNWEPKIGIDAGLKQTLEFYLS